MRSFNIGFTGATIEEITEAVASLSGNVSPVWRITKTDKWVTLQGITEEDLLILRLKFNIKSKFELKELKYD